MPTPSLIFRVRLFLFIYFSRLRVALVLFVCLLFGVGIYILHMLFEGYDKLWAWYDGLCTRAESYKER